MSAVLLVFLAIPHAVSYSASQMDAMRAPHFVSHDFAQSRAGERPGNVRFNLLDTVTAPGEPPAPARGASVLGKRNRAHIGGATKTFALNHP